jgi:hypothetical protein
MKYLSFTLHKLLPLDHILSHLYPINTHTANFFIIHFNIIVPSIFTFLKWVLPFRFSYYSITHISHTHECYISHLSRIEKYLRAQFCRASCRLGLLEQPLNKPPSSVSLAYSACRLTQSNSEFSSNYGCQCNGSRGEYTLNSWIFLWETLVPWTGLYPNRSEQEREETLHPSGRIAPPSLSEQLKAGKKICSMAVWWW